MKRSIRLRIEKNPLLLNTISTYNAACNDIMKVGYETTGWEKNGLHQATYYKIRKKYPNLPSSLVCTARDQASTMLKHNKGKVLPVKSDYSSIRYNARTISINLLKEQLSIATTDGRLKISLRIPEHFKKYANWKSQAATLGLKNGNLMLVLNLENQTPEKLKVENDSDGNPEVLGIDRGILNPAVTSDNRFFNSRKIRKVKGRYRFLRSRLQAKDTKSAKRKLKKLSGRENRFVADVNHQISKEIVNSEAAAFSLEKLKIEKKKSNGRRFNRKLGRWSYFQLQEFLEYKAEELGKLVVYVNPAYTSQTCSNCGFKKKSNRNGCIFKCKKCNFELHADLNAARNIANLGRSEVSRLHVNQPIVASEDAGLRNPEEDSYKPPVSTGGN